jgi:hypothetical protein
VESHGYTARHLGEGSEEVRGARSILLAASGILPDKSSLTSVRAKSGWQYASRSEQNALAPWSERRQRAVDAREHFFFPEHFEQMIKTRSHSAASRREPYGMNDCAEFYAELCCGTF